MTTPQQYPLTWPKSRPRKTYRKPGQFRHADRPITLAVAVDRVEMQVEKIGGKNVLISTNVKPVISGRPSVDVQDPGVCVYFSLKGSPMAMACDTYSAVPQNLAAVAAHLEAVRAQERYGVATTEESLRAFAELPAPSASVLPGGWRVFFGDVKTAAEVQTKYRELAKTAVTEERLKNINIARDEALRELDA